jgi:hypothetical protein
METTQVPKPKIPVKYCPGCDTVKPVTDFSPLRKNDLELIPSKRQGVCKPCNSLRRRGYPLKPEVNERFYARHGGRNEYQRVRRRIRLGLESEE